jgi:hypothetical protein
MVALDGASFIVAAFAVAGLRLREPRPAPPRHRWATEVTQGARHVLGDAALRRAVLAVGLSTLVLGATETTSFAYVDRGLHRPPAFLAVLVTVQSVGGLLSGALAAPVVRRVGELGSIALGLLTMAAGVSLMTYPSLGLAFVAVPLAGMGLPLVLVGLNTLVQRRTPAALMGRVWTVNGMFVDGPQALSIAASAILVSIVDFRVLLAAIGAVLFAVSAGVWSTRRLTPPLRSAPLIPVDAAPVDAGRAV